MNKNVTLDKMLNLICGLVCDLFDIHVNTEQYRFFASTLFPNITLATLCGYHTNRWKHSSHRLPSRTKKRIKGIGFRKIFYLCNAVLTARHIDCSYLPPNYHIIVKMNKTNTEELTP